LSVTVGIIITVFSEASIDVSPMADPQDNNLMTVNIKHYPIVTNSETIFSESRICEFLRMFQGFVFIAKEGFAYTFLDV
jgi:hypothetical protein